MIQYILSILWPALARRTANCLLRVPALLLALGPPSARGTAAMGGRPATARARRVGRRRNNTWQQLRALDDATLRDIGMTRPTLGVYLLDPAQDKPGLDAPATARTVVQPLPLRVCT
jgi:hypothetical protein